MDAATIDLLHFQRTALQKLLALLQIEAGGYSATAQAQVSYARIRSRLQVLSVLSEVGPSQQIDAVSMIARLVKSCATLYGVPDANQSITIATGQFARPVPLAYALTMGLLIVESLSALLEPETQPPSDNTHLRVAPDGANRITLSVASPGRETSEDKPPYPTAIAQLLAEEIGATLDVRWGAESTIVITLASDRP